jgi:hypothetical protein
MKRNSPRQRYATAEDLEERIRRMYRYYCPETTYEVDNVLERELNAAHVDDENTEVVGDAPPPPEESKRSPTRDKHSRRLQKLLQRLIEEWGPEPTSPSASVPRQRSPKRQSGADSPWPWDGDGFYDDVGRRMKQKRPLGVIDLSLQRETFCSKESKMRREIANEFRGFLHECRRRFDDQKKDILDRAHVQELTAAVQLEREYSRRELEAAERRRQEHEWEVFQQVQRVAMVGLEFHERQDIFHDWFTQLQELRRKELKSLQVVQRILAKHKRLAAIRRRAQIDGNDAQLAATAKRQAQLLLTQREEELAQMLETDRPSTSETKRTASREGSDRPHAHFQVDEDKRESGALVPHSKSRSFRVATFDTKTHRDDPESPLRSSSRTRDGSPPHASGSSLRRESTASGRDAQNCGVKFIPPLVFPTVEVACSPPAPLRDRLEPLPAKNSIPTEAVKREQLRRLSVLNEQQRILIMRRMTTRRHEREAERVAAEIACQRAKETLEAVRKRLPTIRR